MRTYYSALLLENGHLLSYNGSPANAQLEGKLVRMMLTRNAHTRQSQCG